ncbi:MAG: metallophosphoesterase [Ruminococcus sp.]
MKKSLKIIILSILTIAVVTVIYGLYCSNTLEVRNYTIKSDKVNSPVRFVFISDLHCKEYGNKNSDLVAKIKEQNPEFIAVGGDMVNKYSADDHVMRELLPQLAEIAPTYCILGNHELYIKDEIDFKNDIDSTGAQLLDNEMVTLEINGEKILLGGMSDFPYYEFNAPDFDTPERYFWDEFKENSKDCYSILLHHQPEYLESIMQDSNVDLVMCGHTHGGAVQIPFVGGVFAPNQGFFPKYDKGEFDLYNTKMIISAGLGDAYPILRLNNCPEISVVEIN